jgi:hypothetical protein
VGVPGDEDSDLGCEGTSEWRALAGLESAPNQLGFVRVGTWALAEPIARLAVGFAAPVCHTPEWDVV